MTLTYKLELDILRLDIHAKIKVCMYVCLARRVRRTHTDRQTHDVNTITPDTSETWCVIIELQLQRWQRVLSSVYYGGDLCFPVLMTISWED